MLTPSSTHRRQTKERSSSRFPPLTFGFEGKVAVLASVWTDVCVRSNVLLEHAWLLTANATFSTYVLAPAATSHVHILFIGLVPAKERGGEKQTENKLQRATIFRRMP